MSTVRIAIIGCGGISLQNHVPGIRLCPETKLVALCDSDPAALNRARQQTGVAVCATDYQEIVRRDDVDAVIIATPNHLHARIALAAIANGKHVLCEKPLALTGVEALAMAEAAEKAGVRHMTAFTYRFVPAMRYLRHLVRRGDLGEPYHYRSCRLQDWGKRNLGWRQIKSMAGTGELGDMLSHRIDFAHVLIGPFAKVVAAMKRLVPVRGGVANELEDWVAVLGEFKNGATGVLESSKVASGRNESWRSLDYVEINGSEMSFVFMTGSWDRLRVGKAGGSGLEEVQVPEEYWRWPGSPRDPRAYDPLVAFRYDQIWEFVDAIRHGRACDATFYDGARVQFVMDAVVESAESGGWIGVGEK